MLKIPAQAHLMALFRGEKPLLVRFSISSVMRSVFALAGILLIKEFLSGVLGEGGGLAGPIAASLGPGAALWIVAALLVLTYVGASVFNYDNQITQQRIVKVIELGMMERLIRHLLQLSVPFFDRQSHGDIIQAVRQDVSELRTVVLSLANLVFEGVLAVGLFVAAISLSPRLTLWAMIVVPIALFPLFRIARGILIRSRSVRSRGYVLFDVILQILRGIRVVKAYRGEEEEARTAVEKGRLYFDELIEMTRVRALARVVLESLAGFGLVVGVVLGGFQVLSGSLSWPSLLAFLMALRALHGPLNNMNTAYVQAKNYGAAVERITDLLAAQPEVPDAVDAERLERAPRMIAFDLVSFGYGDRTILHDVDFEVRSGETIGIAGPSGVGKTTLLNLAARFYDPTRGAVRFDGTDLRRFRLGDVYEKIAIVTQEPFLFATTVRDNIRVGRPDATDAEVEDAARAAEIHEDILGFVDGYDTAVGIGARALSTGQAQRVNIARALLKNAPILLLDEATSSLDSLSEAKVQSAIDRLMRGRTTFVVAHRLSTLRSADRILVLDDGRCVGLGPHEELVATCPLYARMWETQQMGGAPARRVLSVDDHDDEVVDWEVP